MPWHRKPTKDVTSCDKPRGGAYGPGSADVRMGEPTRGHARVPPAEHIGGAEATRGTETSKYPEEEKSTEIARVAASEERKRASPNPRTCKPAGVAACGVAGPPAPGLPARDAVTKELGSGTAWEGRRDRVRAPYAAPSSPHVAVPEYGRARETRSEAGGTTLQG